jgi:hypothetical protein
MDLLLPELRKAKHQGVSLIMDYLRANLPSLMRYIIAGLIAIALFKAVEAVTAPASPAVAPSQRVSYPAYQSPSRQNQTPLSSWPQRQAPGPFTDYQEWRRRQEQEQQLWQLQERQEEMEREMRQLEDCQRAAQSESPFATNPWLCP